MVNEYSLPDIPAYITVRLGYADADGENVTVPFPQYIKSVVSLNVSPDIPASSLCAIIYSVITKALFRISSSYYRKLGYGFDITADPQADMYFEGGAFVYDNVSKLTGGIFDGYITREGEGEPIDAQICFEGVRCRGLSVEGSIDMGGMGKDCIDILKKYYGEDIIIRDSVPVSGLSNLYLLKYPLRPGDSGPNVSGLQISLNKIGANYQTIPYIENADGVFGTETEEALREFQRIFDLEPTGEVDKGTYYKLLYVLDSIYRLSYLVSLEQQFRDIPTDLRSELKYGDVGNQVKLLQYYLLFVSSFDRRVPPLQVVGVYGEKTYQSVTAFQRIFGFNPDGIVTEEVWEQLRNVYEGLFESMPPSAFSETAVPYGGNILILGSVGGDVRYLQLYLREVGGIYPNFPDITVNGVFDETTENAVKAFQRLFGIKETGVVTSTTWNIISEVYNAIKAGE